MLSKHEYLFWRTVCNDCLDATRNFSKKLCTYLREKKEGGRDLGGQSFREGCRDEARERQRGIEKYGDRERETSKICGSTEKERKMKRDRGKENSR